jgi:hypothetical protein
MFVYMTPPSGILLTSVLLLKGDFLTSFFMSQVDLYMHLEVDIFREYFYANDRKTLNLIYVDHIVIDLQHMNTALHKSVAF